MAYTIPKDKAAGRYRITAQYTGGSSYQPSSTIAFLTIVDKVPEISVSKPAESDTVSGQYQFQMSIEDENLKEWSVFVDTSRVDPQVSSSNIGLNMSYDLATNELYDGNHNLIIFAEDVSGLSSMESLTFLVDNKKSPHEPVGLYAGGGDQRVALMWDPNLEGDIAGYDVYRSLTSGSGYEKINQTLIPDSSTNFIDTDVSNNITYYYVLKAVDRSGLHSSYGVEANASPGTDVQAPSVEVLLDPPSPKAGEAVLVLLNPSEPIFEKPDFELALPDEQGAISIELDRYGQYWIGEFEIADSIRTGSAQFDILVADAAGNLGTQITYGKSLEISYIAGPNIMWSFNAGSPIEWLDRWQDGYAAGDLSGDKVADVVFGTREGDVVAVDGANGTALWRYGFSHSADTLNADIVDIDGDGTLEVIAGGRSSPARSEIVALKNNGEMKWKAAGDYQNVTDFAYGDVNNDGHGDVIASVGKYPWGGCQVLLFDGRDGSRIWNADTNLGSGYPMAVDAKDLDGDGEMEVAVTNYNNRVFLLNGKTGSVIWSYPGIYHGRDVIIADVNDDGEQEIVASLGDMYCFRKDSYKMWSIPGKGDRVKACDPDDDGKTDLLVSHEINGTTSLIDGKTGEVRWTKTIGGAADAGDIDGDGTDDIITCTLKLGKPKPDSHYVAVLGGDETIKYKYDLDGAPSAIVTANIDADASKEILVAVDSTLLAIDITKPTKIEWERDELAIPKDFHLFQNYPNPFNMSTTLAFKLPSSSEVTIKIYNLLGQEIKSLLNAKMTEGIHKVTWDGRDNEGRYVTSGIYLFRFTTEDYAKTRKCLVLR
jgi:hypothetical protein